MAVYRTKGVCSRSINFSVSDEGNLHDVSFEGGCHGNLQGICKLVEGMPVDKVLERLSGIRCESKFTSCPDQLASALREYLNKHGKHVKTRGKD